MIWKFLKKLPLSYVVVVVKSPQAPEDAHGRRAKSNGAVRVSKSVGASGSRDVRLATEGVIGLRPRYLRGLDGGAIRAAASATNVALGTLLLISSQAVAVPMEETLTLGADDWIGSNADGTGAPGPRVHLDVPCPKEK